MTPAGTVAGATTTTIALTGDVMLGRLVDQHVIQNRSVDPEARRSGIHIRFASKLSAPTAKSGRPVFMS